MQERLIVVTLLKPSKYTVMNDTDCRADGLTDFFHLILYVATDEKPRKDRGGEEYHCLYAEEDKSKSPDPRPLTQMQCCIPQTTRTPF